MSLTIKQCLNSWYVTMYNVTISYYTKGAISNCLQVVTFDQISGVLIGRLKILAASNIAPRSYQQLITTGDF